MLFLVGTLSSCQEVEDGNSPTNVENKSEKIDKLYYENGQLKEEGNYVNGKKEGLFKVYYENGQLEKEVDYVNGKLKGK